MTSVNINQIIQEAKMTTARSGGPGGQHVNKVETKVVLRWSLIDSEVLREDQKDELKVKLASKLTKDGELLITADGNRSQLKNKEIAVRKLKKLVTEALTKKKARRPTKPSKAAKQKRLTNKKRHSEKKEMRKKLM